MCLWQNSEMYEVLELEEKDAIYGYKHLDVTAGGVLLSPHYYQKYLPNEAMSIGRKQSVLVDWNAQRGFYVYDKIEAAKEAAGHHGVIVRVKMWGRVVRYKKRRLPAKWLGSEADRSGARAQKVQVVRIMAPAHIIPRLRGSGYKNVHPRRGG